MLDKNRCVVNNRFSYAVDAGIQFESGQVGKLVLGTDGQPTIELCNSGELPHGILWNDKALGMTMTVNEEEITFNVATKSLKHNNLVASQERVTNAARTITYVKGVDYDLDESAGQITRLGGGIIAGQKVLVTYRFNILAKDLYQYGQGQNFINDSTLGSGKITVAEDFAIVYTYIYDTQVPYAIGDALRVKDGGIITADPYESGPIIGKVIKPPTAGDPALGIETRLVLPND